MLRNLAGRPLRAALTTLGIAFAVPMVVLGLFWRDAIDHMIEVQFNLVERGNTSVTFPHPLDRAIIGDLAREPGVLAVEGERIVPVRLRAGHRTYLTSVIGLPARGELRRPHDAALRPIDIAPDGITLTRRLAERLGVAAGDIMTIEVMEGKRRKRRCSGQRDRRRGDRHGLLYGDRCAQSADRRRRRGFGGGTCSSSRQRCRRFRGASRICRSSNRWR